MTSSLNASVVSSHLFWRCAKRTHHGIMHAIATPVRYTKAICTTGFPFGGWEIPTLMLRKCPICEILERATPQAHSGNR